MRSVYQATTTVPSLSNVNLVLALETARRPGIITLSPGSHLCTFESQLSDVYTYQYITKFRHCEYKRFYLKIEDENFFTPQLSEVRGSERRKSLHYLRRGLLWHTL